MRHAVRFETNEADGDRQFDNAVLRITSGYWILTAFQRVLRLTRFDTRSYETGATEMVCHME